jgi:putative phosphoribosyl transferase
MYLHDRAEAGRLLSEQLMHFRYEDTAVLALSAGGVRVGYEIAKRLHSTLSVLALNRISAPGEESLVLGTIDQDGGYNANELIPTAQMDDYMQEMRGYLEEEKMHKMYEMAEVLGDNGSIDRAQLRGRNIILVTDGVRTGMSFDAALHFLKPISTQQIIAAIPLGPGDVIERIRHKIDELHYLYIPDNFISVHHYYEVDDKPTPDEIATIMDTVIANWI